jgi:SAM-dependent methyltransferase
VDAVPAAWRRAARTVVREAPIRAMDLSSDAREALFRMPEALPSARLRRRVGGNSARREFLRIGRAASEDIRAALQRCGVHEAPLGRWLDFGCGSGRMARHVAEWPFVREIWGVDVDAEAIAWMRGHVRGRWETVARWPPTPLPSGYFDAVYAISVFTHLDEAAGLDWLGEIHRVLKPGGILVVSTSPPSMSWGRPDMTDAERERLIGDGFLFLPGRGRDFNEDTAFHENEYLRRVWGELFGQRIFLGLGVAGYQDLTVWEKWG